MKPTPKLPTSRPWWKPWWLTTSFCVFVLITAAMVGGFALRVYAPEWADILKEFF